MVGEDQRDFLAENRMGAGVPARPPRPDKPDELKYLKKKDFGKVGGRGGGGTDKGRGRDGGGCWEKGT